MPKTLLKTYGGARSARKTAVLRKVWPRARAWTRVKNDPASTGRPARIRPQLVLSLPLAGDEQVGGVVPRWWAAGFVSQKEVRLIELSPTGGRSWTHQYHAPEAAQARGERGALYELSARASRPLDDTVTGHYAGRRGRGHSSTGRAPPPPRRHMVWAWWTGRRGVTAVSARRGTFGCRTTASLDPRPPVGIMPAWRRRAAIRTDYYLGRASARRSRWSRSGRCHTGLACRCWPGTQVVAC